MKVIQKGHRITTIENKVTNFVESENRNDLYMYIYILYIHVMTNL